MADSPGTDAAAFRAAVEPAWSDAQVRFLAEAGAVLASSLDYEAILNQIARLAVVSLADWCAVALVEPGHAPRRVALACAEPARWSLADALLDYQLPSDLPYGYAYVIRTGEPQLLEYLSPNYFDRLPLDPAYHQLLKLVAPRAMLSLPLIVRGVTRGAITLTMAESRRHFTAEGIALAGELARRTAVAVDNALLYRAANRRLAELTTVQRVAQAISSDLELDAICQTVVEQISTAFGYRMVSIYLHDGHNLVLQYYVGYSRVMHVLRPGQGASWRVVRSGQAVFVKDADNDPDFIKVLPDTTQGIIVPLRYGDGPVLGVVIVESTGTPVLADDDLTLLSLLADQISVAIINGKLLAQARGLAHRFQSLIELAGSLIICLGPDMRITEFNREAERLYGVERAQALGMHFLERLVSPSWQPTLAALIRAVLAGELVRPFESSVRDQAGHERTLIWTVSCRRDASGAAEELLVVGQDITERRQAEEARLAIERRLLVAQRLESLGVLAGGIAHDFNNLLAAIIGNASLLRLDVAPQSPAYESAVAIELVANRAADLVGQMLAYAGRGRFQVEPLDLNELVREMIVLLRVSVRKDAMLQEELRADLPLIEADGSQIRQVVMNLVINASEALPREGGQITIATRHRLLAADTPFGVYSGEEPAPGSYVELVVADTGVGMDAATQARIFDPFFTTKFTGRGLGLAAVLGIVRSHRGALQIASAPGRGSRFTMLFPAQPDLQPAPVPALAQLPAALPTAQARRRILVVDDEPPMRQMAVRVLERGGYMVLVAADGVEALHSIQTDPTIAAVLLDQTMPGLDGIQTFEQIRAARPALPVALMSGYTVEELSGRFGRELPAFLHKPFNAQTLLDLIATMVPA